MNKNINFLLFTIIIGTLFTGCKKYTFDKNVTGESIVVDDFKLLTPSNGTVVKLNSATPSSPIQITWSPAKKSLRSEITYKWIAQVKGSSIDQYIVDYPADNSGKSSSLTITQNQLDELLKARGISAGATVPLIWSVLAQNGTTTERCQNVFDITVTRFQNGASPFVLLGPVSKQENVTINPTSTTDFLKFNWTKSKPGVAANPIKYKVWFASEGQIATPKFSINSNNSGSDSLLTVSYKDFSDSLVKYGYPLTDLAKLQWTVTATSGTEPAVFTQFADFPNTLYILREVKMFLVGDITGWDINNPIELIADPASSRTGKVFYTYFKVNTTAQFLFIKEKGNWGSKYGITGGSAPTYDIGFNTGGDFFITTPGIYRLTIDAGSLKAHIQQKQVGLVGQFQGWDPGAPVNGGYITRDKFIILQNINLTDEFKFHDGPVWDNSSPDKARWWGKGSTAGSLDNDGNGPNLNNETGTSGLVRCIWDGTNPQKVKYTMTKGQLRIVGALPEIGSWTPDNALDMVYMGNGVWQKTVTLSAPSEFKFVSASGWDFNYGDAGGGKISEGAGNYSRPAGTYTITVDEYNRTCTII